MSKGISGKKIKSPNFNGAETKAKIGQFMEHF